MKQLLILMVLIVNIQTSHSLTSDSLASDHSCPHKKLEVTFSCLGNPDDAQEALIGSMGIFKIYKKEKVPGKMICGFASDDYSIQFFSEDGLINIKSLEELKTFFQSSAQRGLLGTQIDVSTQTIQGPRLNLTHPRLSSFTDKNWYEEEFSIGLGGYHVKRHATAMYFLSSSDGKSFTAGRGCRLKIRVLE